MASRPRTIKNRKLPPNLYPNGKYWRYRNPITGHRVQSRQRTKTNSHDALLKKCCAPPQAWA